MKIRKRHLHEIRVIKRFAIFPVFARDDGRWLEWVRIEQEYRPDMHEFKRWHNNRFVD